MEIKVDTSHSPDTSLIKSPMAANRNEYNRRKYYSAIKTGFNHLNKGDAKARQSFLRPPEQGEMLPQIFPMIGQKNEQKSSSMVIIFSCWNTMVGSAMVSLPWAYQESGIILGILISFTSFVISFYTCSLIIKTAKNDEDYVFTLKKYYGKPGFYIGLIGPTVLIFGAITVYFVVIVQSLYPILYLIFKKGFKMDLDYINPNESPFFHIETFSSSYVALLMFVILVTVSMKKDLTIFMKMGSIGAVCVTSLIIFVVAYSIYSISNTTYAFNISSSDIDPNIFDHQNLLLFNSGYSSLAGVLCAGYFIHQCSLPIIANAAEPEKNIRNVFIGYCMVFMCYVVVGTLGYIAFSGSTFIADHSGDTIGTINIEQNFLSMFKYDAPPAIAVRLMLFTQLSCSYPLVNHFQRCLLVNLLFKQGSTLENLPDFKYRCLNLGISVVPLTFALFYPKIGTILGYAASVSGFFMIYVIPVITYMKMRKIEILHPELAEAIQQNEVQLVIPKRKVFPMQSPRVEGSTGGEELDPSMFSLSPKLMINDRFLKRQEGIPVINRDSGNTDSVQSMPLLSDNTEFQEKKGVQEKLRQWRISYALHMIIPIYGLGIVILTFAS